MIENAKVPYEDLTMLERNVAQLWLAGRVAMATGQTIHECLPYVVAAFARLVPHPWQVRNETHNKAN